MLLTRYQRRAAGFALILGGALLSGTAAFSQAAQFEVGERGPYPQGYFDWCGKDLSRCIDDLSANDTPEIIYNDNIRKILDRVNRYWNHNTIPTTDLQNYGATEKWIIAKKGSKADCEDIMLAKERHLRLRYKFPANALIKTFVRTPEGEGHAVLTVHTTDGDYVLDNRSNIIKRWNETDLTFVSAMVRGEWRQVTTQKIGPGTTTVTHDPAHWLFSKQSARQWLNP